VNRKHWLIGVLALVLLALPLGAQAAPFWAAAPAQQRSTPTGNVSLSLDPSDGIFAQGDTITVSIRAAAGSESIDGISIYLDFDPALFEVVSADGTAASAIEPLDFSPANGATIIENIVDHAAGQINFTAVLLSGSRSGDLIPAQFRLRVKTAARGSASLHFHQALPRETQVVGGGSGRLGLVTDATYTLNPSPLPGDVNGDCQITVEDVQAIVGRWHQEVGRPYDLNDDGRVTITDIQTVASHWGASCPATAAGTP
jgi:hypothetical protein